MTKAVLIQNPASIYDDVPGERYHFPRRYLSTLEQCVGDWIVFYEGRKGVLGYVSIQMVRSIRPDPVRDDHYYAEMDQGSHLQFPVRVPRLDPMGRPYEAMLRTPDGKPIRGGANVRAVRRLNEGDFAAIVSAGLDSELAEATPGAEVVLPAGFAAPGTPFDHDAPLSHIRETVLTNRKLRDASFARLVKTAYSGRCAMSGLMLRNGGGAAEVQAAHIRPVEKDGPDIVQNGLALSGTLHWMFDRGLLSVASDMTILVAHNKVDLETVDRLLVQDRRLRLPENPRFHPHPAYLEYHREAIFGGLT